MIKVIMHGCNGRMGQVITGLIAAEEQMEIVAGVDAYNQKENTYPVYSSLADVKEKADVLIDFSSSTVTDSLLEFCVENALPCVLCTTGLDDAQIKKVQEASAKVAILRSANMSVGINLLMKVLRETTKTLSDAGFDIEIVEKHHNQKKDAPSGTAIALADVMREELDSSYEYVYDRSGRREVRPQKEIGISAVRGGTIVGDHDVIFAGCDEVITFSHRAYSRSVFAKGAVEAAKFLAGKGAGLYNMSDVIG